MKHLKSLLSTLIIASTLAFSASPAQARLPSSDGQQALPSLAPMIEKASPAVVSISTKATVNNYVNPLLQDPFFRRFFGVPNQPRQRQAQSAGSGVIVDAKNGYIITNHHVIANADEIEVHLKDGRDMSAKVIGTDPDADIAVLQIKADKLDALALANSDQLRVGDFVVAIGNPFGLGHTVTSGIVSALGRSGLGIEGYEDFIQTDASINPGNSGGALVNLRGELVGINTAIIAPSGGNVGIGFAIPSNMAQAIVDQLIEHGEVRRGRLGVVAQDLTPELAKAFDVKGKHGVAVAQVLKKSPAEKAGLKAGDIITHVNGKRLKSANEIRNLVGLLPIGSQIKFTVLRNGKKRSLTITVEEDETIISQNKLSPLLKGVVFGETDPNAVIIQDLERNSLAARAGLRPNDIILSVNQHPVENLEDLAKLAGKTRGRLLLHVLRDKQAFFVMLR